MNGDHFHRVRPGSCDGVVRDAGLKNEPCWSRAIVCPNSGPDITSELLVPLCCVALPHITCERGRRSDPRLGGQGTRGPRSARIEHEAHVVVTLEVAARNVRDEVLQVVEELRRMSVMTETHHSR